MNCRLAISYGSCGRYAASAVLLATFLVSQSGPAWPQAVLPEAPTDFPSTPSGPEALSPEELDDFGLVMEGATASEVIARAEAFGHQYPDSQLLPLAQLREMKAEIQLDSYEGAVSIGHEILRRTPKNLEALVLMAGVLPNFPASYPAERKARALKEAGEDVQAAGQLLHTLHIREGVSARTFLKNRRKLSASLKEASAFVDLASGNYQSAIRQYRVALEMDSTPPAATFLRLGFAYYKAGQVENARSPLEKAMQADTGLIRKEADRLLKEIAASSNVIRSAPGGSVQ